jgi:hypothetical protein
LTRIKAVLAVAAALLLTAVGAGGAFAWEGVTLSAQVDCKDGKVVVHGTDNHAQDLQKHHTGFLVFTDSEGHKVTTQAWTFSESSDVIAEVDLEHFSGGSHFKVHLKEDSRVESEEFTIDCSKPTPTATPKPTAAPTATPTETTAPTATAAPTATSLPSPPTTGQGSNGSGPSFGIALLALALGTAVTGGVILALARGRKEETP